MWKVETTDFNINQKCSNICSVAFIFYKPKNTMETINKMQKLWEQKFRF